MQDYIPLSGQKSGALDINATLKSFEIKQYDNNSRKIYISLRDTDNPNEQTVNLDNHTVRAYFKLPDGGMEYVDGEVIDSGEGTLAVTIPNSVTQQIGTVECEIGISGVDDGSFISLRVLRFTVAKSIRDDSAIEATEQFSALDNALHAVDSLVTTAREIEALETKLVTVESEIERITTHELRNYEQLLECGVYDGCEREYSATDIAINLISDLKVTNAIFKSENGACITMTNYGYKNVTFENCTFDKVVFAIWDTNCYAFKNCEFINGHKNSIAVLGKDNYITIESCEFLRTRPDVGAWNNNTDGIRSYGSAPIYIYGGNNKCDIFNSTFDDNVSPQQIFIPSGTTGTEMVIKNNLFKNTFGGCIIFNNSVKGIISNNSFKNIGGIRGEYSYYVANENLGVGCNAMYCLNCIDLNVTNNEIVNVVENGIEGHFNSVCNNYVENPGYRYSEGYTTPSTECYYIAAKTITGNMAINPYNKSAFIITNVSDFFDKAIISSNNALSDTPNAEGAYYFTDTGECNCVVRNNICNNFTSIYRTNEDRVLKGYILSLENENQFYSVKASSFKNCKLVSSCKKLYLPSSDEILHSNGTVEIIQEDGVNVIHLTSSDIYGHIMINGETECKGLPCGINLIIKSDKAFEISIASKNNEGNTPKTDTYAVYGGQRHQYDATLDYTEINGIFPIYGNYTLNIWCTEAAQDIYIKKIEINA